MNASFSSICSLGRDGYCAWDTELHIHSDGQACLRVCTLSARAVTCARSSTGNRCAGTCSKRNFSLLLLGLARRLRRSDGSGRVDNVHAALDRGEDNVARGEVRVVGPGAGEARRAAVRSVVQVAGAREDRVLAGLVDGEDLQAAIMANDESSSHSNHEAGNSANLAATDNSEVRARVLYAYDAEDDGNISLSVDETVVVKEQDDADWWYGHVSGLPEKLGFFPAAFVEVVLEDDV